MRGRRRFDTGTGHMGNWWGKPKPTQGGLIEQTTKAPPKPKPQPKPQTPKGPPRNDATS